MSVFLIQMGIVFLIDKQAAEKSHIPVEFKQNRIDKGAGTLANFFWLCAMVYSILKPLRLGTVVFYIGFILFLIGLVILVSATYYFVNRSSKEVMTKGVYTLSRHPMYVATFFICLGAGVASASWVLIALTLLLSGCFYKEALLEEKYCLNTFGNAYIRYMRKTPRWFGLPRMQ